MGVADRTFWVGIWLKGPFIENEFCENSFSFWEICNDAGGS